jgi:hypothetical protein
LRLPKLIVLVILLLAFVSSVPADTPSDRLLAERVGKFKQVSAATQSSLQKNSDDVSAPPITQTAEYAGNNGNRASVEITRFRQEGEAYEAFSVFASNVQKSTSGAEIGTSIGTAGFATNDEVAFFKGLHFVRVRNVKANPAALTELAQGLSESLDKGEGDIPVLIKHLPAPEEAQKNAVYLHNFADLNTLPFQHSIISTVQSGGNADAVFATYGPSKVLLIEFHTPQLAADNDQRIIARIQELWKLGQPAPTAYRRVGNYSVFVFDAPDEQTAKQLIGQVKYEQVVQWLGENPNIFKEAERRYINTTLGVLIAVLKASGYVLITCLGVGGLIGGLLFSYRRAQQKGVAAFSDAGGMLRLNLDEMTPQTDPARLLRERN